jgi:hypothetical protein
MRTVVTDLPARRPEMDTVRIVPNTPPARRPPRSVDASKRDWRTQQDLAVLATKARLLLLSVIGTTGAAAGTGALLLTLALRRDAGRQHAELIAGVAAAAGAALFTIYVFRVGYRQHHMRLGRRTINKTQPASARVQARADELALAVGLSRFDVTVIPDDTINAATFGPVGDAHIVLTKGATELEHAQLDAMLAYCVVQLADHHLRVVRDTLTAVDLYAKLTKLMWATVIVAYVAGMVVGANGPLVTIAALGTFGVLIAVLCGTLAAVAGAGLANAAATIADSKAVTHTLQAEAYAELLIAMVGDTSLTDTTMSPLLWMERDVTRDSLTAVVGGFRTDREMKTRARRMCTIAGVEAPARWNDKAHQGRATR